MTTAGIILSNLHDAEIPMLTGKRTMGAVPIGGHYRMIDFPLSGMVHAGIRNIFVIAHHNYQSMMEHIGSGKDWDLARRKGGIHIMPPYSAAYANPVECYDSRLQSLNSIRGLLERLEEDCVLCADCDMAGAPDINKLLQEHKKSGAPFTLCIAGSDDALEKLNIWVANTAFLRGILREAEQKGARSFTADVLRPQFENGNVEVYRVRERLYRIGSLEDYYKFHMMLASDETFRREILEDPLRPILSKVQNAPPVKYGAAAEIGNSMIADGSVVEGKVQNCVLFGGVHIGAGCRAENAVIFENSRLENGASVHSAVLDKNVLLGAGVQLHGHAEMPLFVGERKMIV